MNKIDKLDKELEKAREKAAEWQAKIRELEKQKQEEENSQIVQAVRLSQTDPRRADGISERPPKKQPCRFGPQWPEAGGVRKGGHGP